MKALMTLAALAFAASTAFAADAPAGSCEDQAAAKKLAGAAKNSFLKKCNKDTGASACDTQAAEKKLAGAAKNSFLKKCKADAAK